jgi:PAS domain S-box-containing protein
MRKFIERALNKLAKLDKAQVRALISDLASENERLETVLDSMTEGVLVADETHKLISVNKAATRLVPMVSPVELETAIWTIIADDEISSFVQQALQEQESVNDKEFTLDAAGGTRTLLVSVLPLVRNGKIQGNLIHLEDVTERRNREARLRRAESLASLTTLAAGVAHEIKNPLGSIGIHIQLIQKALQNRDDLDADAVESYVDIINEEVDRLNKIVVNFLFAVRPMDTQLEDANLNAVIEDILAFVGVELEENTIELVADLAEDLPMVQLDEKYLKQAVLNILKNAIAAMPDGGTLRIATELSGDEVLLSITDTGVGIPDEILGKIFEPYFTTRDYGSGIGLTIVYKVVKEHFGDIAVSSQEGRGTTFTIAFPVPQREQHLLGWTNEV